MSRDIFHAVALCCGNSMLDNDKLLEVSTIPAVLFCGDSPNPTKLFQLNE